MLGKKAKVYRLEKLKTIVLFDTDGNLDDKGLGEHRAEEMTKLVMEDLIGVVIIVSHYFLSYKGLALNSHEIQLNDVIKSSLNEVKLHVLFRSHPS